jgi:mannitol-specific phosphotransferase system IIBC component
MGPEVPAGGSTKAGTFGGTLLVLLMHLSSEEVLKTVLLAAIGAVVSFMVSMVLKEVVRRGRKK